MNGTPSNTEEVEENQGWYINFLAAIVKNLPRPGTKPGDIDRATAERWEKEDSSGLKKALASALLPTPPAQTKLAPREKFYLVKTIQVTVPADYDHGSHLTTFRDENYEKFYHFNNNITDGNFSKVSHRLVSGKTYMVKIFGINKGEVATSKECVEKYKQEKALFVGAQGASVVWEGNREDLSKSKWYASFDEKENLPFADGSRRVPYVGADSIGGFDFDLGYFEGGWRDDCCLLCFCDLQSSVA